ncbi:MAG: hypothetical protein JJU29_03260 [Verrucomicrobia bacterium]|nr:hypothetical protein [Verrucomicrobiota bacterium]MCH8510744.1 hypothetical protein [Kiritimatiellia bacterium]
MIKSRSLFWFGILYLAASLPCRAERPAGTGAEELLNRLERLAPWDLTGAKYVRLKHPAANRNWSAGLYESIRLQGNAWLLPGDGDGNGDGEDGRDFVMNGCERIRLWDRISIEEALRVSRRTATPEEVRHGGTWEEVDLRLDVARFLSDGEPPGASRVRFTSTRERGRWAWFAVNVAKAGHREDGLAILRLLLESEKANDSHDHPDVGAKLLNEAISQLADARYAEISREFFRSGDRAAFLNRLETLLDSFGDEWTRRGPIARQVSDMRNPEKKAGWSELEREAYETLLKAPQGNSRPGLWLLPDSGNIQTLRSEVLKELLSQRWQAVPFLLSLLDDYTPTDVDLYAFLDLYRRDEFNLSQSWTYVDPVLMRKHSGMGRNLTTRPLMVAEIARNLLSGTLWLSDEERLQLILREGAEEDPFPAFGETANSWLEARKDLSDLDLILDYLSSEPYALDPVIPYLVRKGEPRIIEAIENRLLQRALRTSYQCPYRFLRTYVEERGNAAEPFLRRYEQQVLQKLESDRASRLQNADAPARERWEKEYAQERSTIEWGLRHLRRTLRGGNVIQELLEEIVSGEIRPMDASIAYREALRKDPEGGMRAALSASLKTDNPFIRHDLVDHAVWAKHRTGPSPIHEEEKTLWRALLDDSVARWGKDNDTGRLADCLLRRTFPSDELREAWHWIWSEHDELASLLGPSASALYIARAYEVLGGKSSEAMIPLPDAQHVSPDRRDILAREWLANEDWEARFAKLSMDEKLAFPEILRDHPALNERLRDFANRVVSIEIKGELPEEDRELLQSFQGKSLNREMVETLLEFSKAQVRGGREGSINDVRQPLLRGVHLTVKFGPPKEEQPGANVYEFAYVSASLHGGTEESTEARWPVEIPEAIRLEVARLRESPNRRFHVFRSPFPAEEEEARQRVFWEAVDRVFNAERNVALQRSLWMHGHPGQW